MTDHELEKVCTDHQFECHERDRHQSKVDELKVVIGTELALRGVERVETPLHSAMDVISVRESLDKHLLLEAGVTTEQLAAGTRQSRSSAIRVLNRYEVAPGASEAPKPKKSHHKKKPAPDESGIPPLTALAIMGATIE